MAYAVVPALDPAWAPLSQQTIEADTTLLLDPAGDVAAGRTPGFGGLVPQRGSALPSIVSGEFLEGVQVANAGHPAWMLMDGLLAADQFTVEFWLQCAVDWASAPNFTTFLQIGKPTGRCLLFNNTSPGLRVQIGTLTGLVGASFSISGGTYLANTWYSVAATLKGGVLALYVQAVQKASVSAITPPPQFGSNDRDDGLVIGAYPWTVSDLRISRLARTPNARTIIAPSSSHITVATSGSGQVQPLNGFLHALPTNGGGTHSPPSTADALQASQPAFSVVRTDKFLTCTPIKAGGTDGTHPTAGHSGAYSYDWQVVDRSMDYLITTLGLSEVYLTLDSVPQLLGGSVAPYTGSQLTTGYAYQSNYSPGPPTGGWTGANISAFASMCADLIYHLITQKGYPVNYADLWNEPDQAGLYWESGGSAVTDYLALYSAVVTAVKAVAPSLKFGGPSVSTWDNVNTAWAQALITYCGANGLPLDFISWHWYSADLSEASYVQAQVAAWAAAAGISTPALIVGEAAWQGANDGYWPWTQPPITGSDPGPDAPVYYFANDWSAGFQAALLILAQQAGVKRFISYQGYLFDATGATQQAQYNVHRLWGMTVGNDILSITATTDPGILAVASKNAGTGKVYVFLASIHYRKTQSYPVIVDVSAVASDGTAVTAYVVDDAHSNQVDAGVGNAGLQTVSTTIGIQGANKVGGGKVGIGLRPRAAALLVIG